VIDVLVRPEGIRRFLHPRLPSTSTHGTGCTLSAAIAARLALGEALFEAVEGAKAYVDRAMARAPGLGRGTGPLDHFPDRP
jgi:hydroxymethylpyrimidine/phosphomethylpyrimidine kinase